MDNKISAITPPFPEVWGIKTIDARGATLIPGLHDHHIHLSAYASSLGSLHCGAPVLETRRQLIDHLAHYEKQHPGEWLRGYAYHPYLIGDIDRDWLDQHIPDNPVRIQHRSGRLWILNSLALRQLGLIEQTKAALPPTIPKGAEIIQGRYTGRLYEEDAWLSTQLGQKMPGLRRASDTLASFGVTGITDCSPRNSTKEFDYFQHAQDTGMLRQSVRMMGCSNLNQAVDNPRLQTAELKIHLLESRLPDFDDICQQVRICRQQNRRVAIHCVSRTELVFALAILGECGVLTGDRLEHAGVAPPELMHRITALNLAVVTQPHFLWEQGDRYLAEVEREDRPWLYLGQSFLRAGVPLAAGSDAPFGSADPWVSMNSAVRRQSRSGLVMGSQDRLTPEQALDLFISCAQFPGRRYRQIEIGEQADLCLLDAPWQIVRNDLNSRHCRLTVSNGQIIYQKDR
ncbi:amidohydrolase family protein [Microbulbifer spongiae]|uniref:Amidohydrolase family protein n=1 Tax=Microbulbifer spongiae TaxID=2944933 RepID=A0ABY9E9A9_9GAMM|nr:amidohydrolase family protein [Microbulbifer sp. MI-G]WKD49030.1 amidohydrolase family protein [Microbulbifer sp. MI-G]